jgi:hypothetical protein
MLQRSFWTTDKSEARNPVLSIDDDARNAVDIPWSCSEYPPEDGEWLAKIICISDELVRPKEGRPFHRVTVLFSVPEDGNPRQCYLEFDKTFELDTASGVAEARRFFALFDFPLNGPRDVVAACKRACQGFCRIRVSRKGRKHAHVEVVELVRKRRVASPADDKKDVWNHQRHWTRGVLWVGELFLKKGNVYVCL